MRAVRSGSPRAKPTAPPRSSCGPSPVTACTTPRTPSDSAVQPTASRPPVPCSGRVAEHPPGAEREHERQQQRAAAEDSAQGLRDRVACPAGVPPDAAGGDHGEGEQQQAEAVAAVRRVEVACGAADRAPRPRRRWRAGARCRAGRARCRRARRRRGRRPRCAGSGRCGRTALGDAPGRPARRALAGAVLPLLLRRGTSRLERPLVGAGVREAMVRTLRRGPPRRASHGGHAG